LGLFKGQRMNERIEKLYGQSFVNENYVNVGPNGTELVIRFDPEKFAELIVRECAELVKDQLKVIPADQKDWDGHNYGYTAAVYESLDRFKEHFGVES
jgi:hypothetical protein